MFLIALNSSIFYILSPIAGLCNWIILIRNLGDFMIRIVSALFLTLSILFFNGCKSDPVNSNFGDEKAGIGEFKTDTIFNISYRNFIKDSLQILFEPAKATNLTLMNKMGVESRIALVVPLKLDVNHFKAEIYLKSKSDGYVGEDFGTSECSVYQITQDWFDEYNQDSRWQDYSTMIGNDPIGSLTITSTDSTTDTLRITDLAFWDEIADTSTINENYGIFIDLPDGISESFIKNYYAYASGDGPQYHYQYKYIDDGDGDPDTTLYGNTSVFFGNHIIINDQSEEYFNDSQNYYYLKTFTPSHLLIDVPFNSILETIQNKNISYLGAYLHLPLNKEISYFEESFHEDLALYPASDTSQTTRVTYTDQYGYINIPLAGWKVDSIDADLTVVYNSSTQSQQELGTEVLMVGLEDTIGHHGWLIEPYKFDRYFNVFAIPKDQKPYLILKYFERPDTRF